MTGDVQATIADAMQNVLGLNYEYMEWTGDEVEMYFTGELQESPPLSEDGKQEGTFILNGFTKSKWSVLHQAKEAIENYFNKISGKVVIAESGNAVAIFYDTGLEIRTESDLKRIQINVTVKEWKVN